MNTDPGPEGPTDSAANVDKGIELTKVLMGESARDIRLNLSSLLSEEGAQGLSLDQIYGIALACAYTCKLMTTPLLSSLKAYFLDSSRAEWVEAAKGASSIMAMNNIYYRFLHLTEHKDFSKLPARLRMSIIGKPGIDRVHFELMCLAVSAIAGCGNCIDSHIAELRKSGLGDEALQSAVRIASVIHATAQALSIGPNP